MPSNAPKPPKPAVILLVDDDGDFRLLVRDILDELAACAIVREVAGGREALDYLYRRGPFAGAPRPDLIYLDIEMPDLSGQDVLEAVKADPHLRDIRVVMLTGIDDERQERRAWARGADGYVVKPADPGRFLRRMAESVSRELCAARAPAGPTGEPEP